MKRTIVAFSGGKDSTALVLRLHQLGEKFECLFTPTGNELPDLIPHIQEVLKIAGDPVLHLPKAPRLFDLIETFNALPNHRQRWCTRMIKIQPCIAWLQKNPGCVLAVGLRADEPERVGLYGEYAEYRYPLQEWGWGIKEVMDYIHSSGVTVPKRTDCALCYGQRLGEWWALWKNHPDQFAQGEALEARTGHTFRSPSRDTWPASLAELRKRFESGDISRGVELDDDLKACRACRL